MAKYTVRHGKRNAPNEFVALSGIGKSILDPTFNINDYIPKAKQGKPIWKADGAGKDKEERMSTKPGDNSNGEVLPDKGGSPFIPGNTFGPDNTAKKATNAEYIAAIKAAFPPEKITEMMDIAIELAVKTNSWRGVVAVAEFAGNYTMGKPKPRTDSPTGDKTLADLLRGIDTSKPLLATVEAGTDDDSEAADSAEPTADADEDADALPSAE